MEKLKEKKAPSKKVIAIAIISVIVVILAIILIVSIVKPSYKKQIKEFAKAMESEEQMDEFVDKYVNLRAMYAMLQMEDEDDFEEEYKNAEKSDYEDEEFVDKIKLAYSSYVLEDEEIKITNIEKLEEDDDTDWAKKADFTIEKDGEEEEVTAYFYKGKIIMVY